MASIHDTMLMPEIRHTELFIGGRWTPASNGKTFPTINPATEEVLAEVAEGTEEDIDSAVRAARDAFEDGPWPRMDARDRGRLMHRLCDLMEEESEELAMLETLDNGKPIRDSRTLDVPGAIETLRYYAGYADKIHGQTIPVRGNRLTYTRREPVGVVGQIIPWNFPLLMLAWKWGPALAAGCTLVLKPAEQTPLTALHMADLAQRAGFPDGVINVVPGDGPTTGAALVRHPGVDKIAFTGEYKTAQIIMREAAPTLKRMTFELGGKSPNIIFSDADLDAAVPAAHHGLYFNQGQCCTAGSRLFVQDRVYDAVVERLAEHNRSYKVGDPLDPQTQQGPQVDKAQFDKVMHYIDLGKEEGAQCVTGGNRVGQCGYFVEPTLFAEVTDRMAIAKDEIFGPVLSVLRFSDLDEIARRANNTFYGLAAAVWTRDIRKAHYLANKLRAGTVWINCYHVYDPAAPFGGFKMSGIGRELGEEGLAHYTETKTVTVDLG
ncbi:MAG: aldehyde dehydrogenase family protein [Thermoguttaceae bacterium]|jgi:aldehyde dehydrogenase (NAD+)|nr:aldehyde dehydrogenase family protein [Thermoguttaceae bacterium]